MKRSKVSPRQCLNCEGEHHRIKEGKVDQIRMSYADAVKKLEEQESLAEQEEVEERGNGADQKNICLDKKGFLPL